MKKWISNLMAKLFGKKTAPAPSPTPVPPPVTTPTPTPVPPPVVIAPVEPKLPTFAEAFSNLDRWIVSTWEAPAGGKFSRNNVSIVDGILCLRLQQTIVNGVVQSVGGEVSTREKFGYGTYEFEVKASSTAAAPTAVGNPVSGTITGCFNYAPSSITEIDMEVEGGTRSNLAQFTSWMLASNPNQSIKVPTVPAPHVEFKKYKFVWTPQGTTFYINGVEACRHTKVIPSEPAPFLFNHWGTNSVDWGGVATPDVERYMWVKNFSFTPL